MLTPFTLLCLDPGVELSEPLKEVSWHHRMDSIRRRKGNALETVGDIKNSSKDIP